MTVFRLTVLTLTVCVLQVVNGASESSTVSEKFNKNDPSVVPDDNQDNKHENADEKKTKEVSVHTVDDKSGGGNKNDLPGGTGDNLLGPKGEPSVKASNGATQNLSSVATGAGTANTGGSVVAGNTSGVVRPTAPKQSQPTLTVPSLDTKHNISSAVNASRLASPLPDSAVKANKTESSLPVQTVKPNASQPLNTTTATESLSNTAKSQVNRTSNVNTSANTSSIHAEETTEGAVMLPSDVAKTGPSKTLNATNVIIPANPIPPPPPAESGTTSSSPLPPPAPSVEPDSPPSEVPSGGAKPDVGGILNTTNITRPSSPLPPPVAPAESDYTPSELPPIAAKPNVSRTLSTTTFQAPKTQPVTTTTRSRVLPVVPEQVTAPSALQPDVRKSTTLRREELPEGLTSDSYPDGIDYDKEYEYNLDGTGQNKPESAGNFPKPDDTGKSKPGGTNQQKKQQKAGWDSPSSNTFMVYFLVLVATVATVYVIYHNRQRIKGLIIEGRQRMDSRKTSRGTYKKLTTKADDVLPEPTLTESIKSYVY